MCGVDVGVGDGEFDRVGGEDQEVVQREVSEGGEGDREEGVVDSWGVLKEGRREGGKEGG